MQDHVKGPCVRARYFVCWLLNAWCVVAHARARGLGASVYVVSSTWVVKAWGVRACLVTRRVVLCCVHLGACVRAVDVRLAHVRACLQVGYFMVLVRGCLVIPCVYAGADVHSFALLGAWRLVCPRVRGCMSACI